MYKYIKRLIDILFSLLLLILLSPLFLILTVLLLLTGEHKVFYRQNRVGFRKQPFKILKFATMLQNSPNIGTGSLTLRNDPRVLPVGRFLRKTKLNELPQIINVLTGDMSIIGPRPIMEVDFKRYPKDIQEIIYNLKPGITGIGSIVFRDEESITSKAKGREAEVYENVIAPYKGALELWYQKNISFITDIKLMFLTCWIIIKPTSRLQYKMLKGLPERI